MSGQPSRSQFRPGWGNAGAVAQAIAEADVEHAERLEQAGGVEAAGLFDGKAGKGHEFGDRGNGSAYTTAEVIAQQQIR